MNLPVVWPVMLAAVLVTMGCSKDDSARIRSAVITEGSLQVANAIPDSPQLTFRIKLASADDWNLLDQLTFRQASQMGLAAAGDYEIEITYIDPLTDDSTDLLPIFELEVVVGTNHTLMIHGDFTSPQALLLEDPVGDLVTQDSVQIEVQVVHMGTVESLDVYFGDPNATLSTETPVATLAPGASTQLSRMDAGIYRLRVTEAGDAQVVYDSGDFNVAGRTQRTIVLHDNVGPDSNTISSFQLTPSGTIEYPNEVARAGFRVVNAVSDEDSITVDLADATSEEDLETVSLEYTEVTEFSVIDATFIDISVAVSSDPGIEAVVATVSLNEDTFYTITISGSVADDSLAVRSSTSPQRRIATLVNLQFINTLRETDNADNPRVDLYVLDVGDALGDGPPRFTQFGFLSSAAATVSPQSVDLVVTTSGTNSILIGPTRVDMAAGTSVIVVAAEAVGGGKPYQMIVRTAE